MLVNLNVVVHEPASICKVWVFGIDVSQLDRYQVVNLEQCKQLNELLTEKWI